MNDRNKLDRAFTEDLLHISAKTYHHIGELVIRGALSPGLQDLCTVILDRDLVSREAIRLNDLYRRRNSITTQVHKLPRL